MIARLLVALVLCTSAIAHAEKPKAAAAKKAVDAWAKAFLTIGDKGDYSKVAALTGDNFRAVVSRQQPDVVCEKTVTDRAKLPEALKCVHDSSVVLREFKAWTKKDMKKLWDPLRDYSDEILEASKTGVLFIHYEEGEGITVIAIIAVSQGADKKPYVSAAYAAESYN